MIPKDAIVSRKLPTKRVDGEPFTKGKEQGIRYKFKCSETQKPYWINFIFSNENAVRNCACWHVEEIEGVADEVICRPCFSIKENRAFDTFVFLEDDLCLVNKFHRSPVKVPRRLAYVLTEQQCRRGE